MPVPGAGSLDQRVLRVVPAAAQPPGLEPGDRADPRAVAGDLRGAACAGAAASGRVRRVAAAGSAADAGRRPAGPVRRGLGRSSGQRGRVDGIRRHNCGVNRVKAYEPAAHQPGGLGRRADRAGVLPAGGHRGDVPLVQGRVGTAAAASQSGQARGRPSVHHGAGLLGGACPALPAARGWREVQLEVDPRADADLGAADDDDADGSGEDLEPAAGRGPEQRAGPHRSGRRARVPASPPDCPAGLERARGTGRRHRQRAQSVVTANPLGGIPIQSKQ